MVASRKIISAEELSNMTLTPEESIPFKQRMNFLKALATLSGRFNSWLNALINITLDTSNAFVSEGESIEDELDKLKLEHKEISKNIVKFRPIVQSILQSDTDKYGKELDELENDINENWAAFEKLLAKAKATKQNNLKQLEQQQVSKLSTSAILVSTPKPAPVEEVKRPSPPAAASRSAISAASYPSAGATSVAHSGLYKPATPGAKQQVENSNENLNRFAPGRAPTGALG